MALVENDLMDIPEIGGNVNGGDKREAKREAAKRFLENKKKKQEEARKAAETLEKELKDKKAQLENYTRAIASINEIEKIL